MPVLSCEHASNAVPESFARLFDTADGRAALASHEGWDRGSAPLAEQFAERFGVPVLTGAVTRLLLDLNRSPDNPRRWSRFSASLPEAAREAIATRYFQPYLRALQVAIEAELAARGAATHLSVHTFTRHFGGLRRATDIGLLFDPDRPLEARLAARWGNALRARLPNRQIDANEPYRGTDDGLTTLLRKAYPADRYAGLELEVCEDLLPDGPAEWTRVLVESFPTGA